MVTPLPMRFRTPETGDRGRRSAESEDESGRGGFNTEEAKNVLMKETHHSDIQVERISFGSAECHADWSIDGNEKELHFKIGRQNP